MRCGFNTYYVCNPGSAGNPYSRIITKIKELQALIKRKHSKALIEVDEVLILKCCTVIAHGAQVLVAGNAIFSATDRNFVINSIKTITNLYWFELFVYIHNIVYNSVVVLVCIYNLQTKF